MLPIIIGYPLSKTYKSMIPNTPPPSSHTHTWSHTDRRHQSVCAILRLCVLWFVCAGEKMSERRWVSKKQRENTTHYSLTHIYMYVCICMYIYRCIYINIHIYKCTCIYTWRQQNLAPNHCAVAHQQGLTHASPYTYIHVYVHMYIYMNTFVYRYKYT